MDQPAAALPAADRRRLRILRAAFITAGLVVASALGALIGRSFSPTLPADVVVRLPFTLPDNVSFGGAGALPVVALSQDGSKLAFVATGVLYARSLDDPTVRRIASVDSATSQVLVSPVFSPDGQSIAYVEGALPREGTLKIVPIEGGAPVKVAPVAFPFGLTWSSRGILIAEKDRGISLITPQGGNRDVLVNLKPG